MKWLLIAVVLGLLGIRPEVAGAGQSSLEMLAARQEIQDFIRTTNLRLRNLEETIKDQQTTLLKLQDENQELRTEVLRLSRVNPAASLEDDIKRLANLIQEVDQKRVADNKLTTEQLKRIQSLVENFVKSGASSRPAPPPVDFSSMETHAYEVQPGDTLTKIVAKLRAEKFSVTQQAIEQANPNVVWTKLQIGQKLVIPVSKD